MLPKSINQKRPIILLLLFLLAPLLLNAQFVISGDAPSNIKWSKLKGENYKIIYPTNIDSLAKRYLWLLESNRENVLSGLDIDPRKTSVILHPHTANSNGMVTWAPKRVELYTQPPSSSSAQNWEKQLVLHESRHVGQISHFSKGIFSYLGVLLGQQIYGAGIGLYSATWFLEGDAVIAETQLSNSGRGRESSFLEYYRATTLNNELRNWDKWRYGSYKHFAPDNYALGYVLNGSIRYKSGVYDYAGINLDRTVKRFYNPFEASRYDKSLTGLPTTKNLIGGLKLLDSIWRDDLIDRGEFTKESVINHKESKYYISYSTPMPISKDSLLYIKRSFSNTTQLVLLSNNKKAEEVLRVLPYNIDEFGVTVKDNNIYFTSIVNDPRWRLEANSNLYAYNIKSNKIKRLSNKHSYHSPTVAPQGDSIAVINYHLKGGSSLVFLNSKSGEQLYSVKAPFNAQLSEIAWVGNAIYSFIITGKGLGVFKYDIKDGNWSTVIEEQNAGLYSLSSRGESLYFSSGIDGVSNIYEYNTLTNKLKRLTNSKMGLHYPSIMGDKLYASRVSLGGYEPVSINLERDVDSSGDADKSGIPVVLKDKILTTTYRYAFAEEFTKQTKEAIGEDQYNISADSKREDITPSEYANMKPKRYSKVGNLFNIHSWAPLYYDIEKVIDNWEGELYEIASLGATIFSQNLLGTATTRFGYSYSKGRNAGHLDFKYSGFYPVFELKAEVNASDRYGLQVKNNKLITKYYSSPLVETNLMSYIPLTYNSNGWLRGFTPLVNWRFSTNTFYNEAKERDMCTNQLNFQFNYYQMLPLAKSAIFPKWGVGATLSAANAPCSGNNFGEAAAISIYGYIPGICERQGLKLAASFQRQFISNSYFYLSNLISGPRGHSGVYSKDFAKFSADYAIPIYLGDITIGPIAYLKRLQIIPFADYAFASGGNRLYTYGTDIILDGHFCRIGTPIGVGVRVNVNGANFNTPYSKTSFDLLFNYSF